MCIVLITTAHPRYAFIAIDNRDEYILRPTSRPHWWTHRPSGHQILSARDLHRQERGTWLGVSKSGRLAILTNYRESALDDPDHAICGVRSRGGMVTSWLGHPANEDLDAFVEKMLNDRSVKGVGGFSLICGDLKAKTADGIKPFAIVSNRSDHLENVPRIAGERNKVWGLSNAVYDENGQWPKIIIGKKLLEEAMEEVVGQDLDEDQLKERLFRVLDHDTFPQQDDPNVTMQERMNALKQSVFIPGFGDQQEWKDMAEAVELGKSKQAFNVIEDHSDSEERTEPVVNFMKGAYGTQRQTLILVDWEGNVTYHERPLWDDHGNQVERGKGDKVIRFKIDEAES
ncbi:NRDE protein-domain-containing protein [Xylariomycetidae sp. FL2044]|nr:NRDE protein-domain-containing protein [Xylariomycetidae sp. FL2044]